MIERANYRFHGWPAIHCVTFENYDLYESNLSRWGRQLKVLKQNVPRTKSQVIEKGDDINRKLAIRNANDAYDQYELNSRLWPQSPIFSLERRDDPKIGKSISHYPIWLDLSNWTVGMNRKIQWRGLAINLSVAFLILAIVIVVFEFRRRRRQSFWQFSILEFILLVGFFSICAWFFSNRERAIQSVIELQAKGVVTSYGTP